MVNPSGIDVHYINESAERMKSIRIDLHLYLLSRYRALLQGRDDPNER
jgi:hypothetical protein